MKKFNFMKWTLLLLLSLAVSLPNVSYAQRKKKKADKLRQALEMSPSEVSTEAVRVMKSIVWMTAESYLSFMLALVNIEALDFDPYIVGRMALAVGAFLVLRGCLLWYLHCSPAGDLPAPASNMLPRLMAVYLVLSVGISSIVLSTGIGG